MVAFVWRCTHDLGITELDKRGNFVCCHPVFDRPFTAPLTATNPAVRGQMLPLVKHKVRP